MIKSKEDYKEYLRADKLALQVNKKWPEWHDNVMIMLSSPCYKFQKLLRKLEYFMNCKNTPLYKPYLIYLRYRFKALSIKYGFTIPPNVFGKGLCIVHYGSIIVSRHAKIGDNCVLHNEVGIGGTEDGRAAKIGDNCFIGPGVKIITEVKLGNNISIGANSVVNKDFPDDNMTIAGAPAKKVSDNNSLEHIWWVYDKRPDIPD